MAPTTTGNSCLGLAEDRLITALSKSANLQAWFGAENAAAAKARIHLQELDDPSDDDEDEYSSAEMAAQLPFAMVMHPEDGQAIRFELDAENGHTKSFLLNVQFQAVASTVSTNQDEFREFVDRCVNVIEDVVSLSLVDYHVTQAVPAGPPQRYSESDEARQPLGEVFIWEWALASEVER